MTTLPTLAVYVVGLGSPILAVVTLVVSQRVLRRGARGLDVWRRREETMRMLRWAAEHAVSADPAGARLGVKVLDALSTSELMQSADDLMMEAVLDAVIEEPVEQLDGAGGSADVVEVDTSPEG